MGLKKFFDNLKKKAEDHLKEETDPAKIRQAKKAAMEKNFKRTTTAIKWAKKGIETYNDVSKKVEQVTDAAAEKTAQLAEKAKPIAEKIDETTKTAFDAVKDKVSKGIEAAGNKIEDVKKDNAGKPSTGSGLLDLLAPAIPETEATSRKPKDETPPAAPKAPPAPPAP